MGQLNAILSIDQGTTNSKALLVDETGSVLSSGSSPLSLSMPEPGWVEQDAEEIWTSVLTAVQSALRAGPGVSIGGISISNQRESVVAWRRSTSVALAPAIGWQDRRTADWCAGLTSPKADALVRGRTGLRIDAMFSAPKLSWLLTRAIDGVPLADVCVGTVDSWLLWRLTGGAEHVCEAGNASRTLLYDVVDLAWSPALLDLFGVPANVLPEVLASDAGYGESAGVPGLPDGTPIVAVMADSHAALYGHGCTEVGMAKATYGTGSSVMTPTASFVAGDSPVPSTLAWLTDAPTYAREGNILSSGATLAWTAQLLGLVDVDDLSRLAAEVADAGGVSLVPAFSGLGAPYWDRTAQAVLVGMTQATTRAHVARAALESVAHQICDVVEEIEASGSPITDFRADGGATASQLLMQTQADLLSRPLLVADLPEVSAIGAARLGWASLGATEEWSVADQPTVVSPAADPSTTRDRRASWRSAVARSRHLSY